MKKNRYIDVNTVKRNIQINKSNYKPGYVLDDHLSRTDVTISFKRPTRDRRATLCLLFGLASDGVYICPVCYHTGGSLLHCPSNLTTNVAVYFCCTFLRVTSTRRYLASCPMKPGLSSPVAFRSYSRDHPLDLYFENISLLKNFVKITD